jgi:N-acetylglucosaminyldiphosphoundecaprenol N-acetyl-beta-D-mannosaminyltransferase
MRTTYQILNIKIDDITYREAKARLGELMSQKNQSLITTPNAEFIVAAQKDENFKRILNRESELNLPDGYGVLWAAKFLSIKLPKKIILRIPIAVLLWLFSLLLLPVFVKVKKAPLKERISGSDFIWEIAKFAVKNNHKLFLLGGAPTVAERTALKLQTDVYGLRIGGVHSGKAEDFAEIQKTINKSRSDILMVAFGAPKQEKWLSQHMKKTCCKIGIGLGGTFDYVAGTQQRAPKWMQNLGLEWLHRLIQEPTRIKRQLSIPKLAWLVLLEKLKSKES